MSDDYKGHPEYQCSNVLDFEIARRATRYGPAKAGGCEHTRVVLDPHGGTVHCRDCEAQVSAYWALEQMAQRWEKAERQLAARNQKVEEMERKQLHLRAAKKIEQAWRGRVMAVACPHCKRGILPEDGLGNSCCSREIEEARRCRGGDK